MNKSFLLAAASVTALLLTACGGGDGGTAESSATSQNDAERAANVANYECTKEQLNIRINAAAESGDAKKLEDAAAFEKKCKAEKLGRWNPELTAAIDGELGCALPVGADIDDKTLADAEKCRAPFTKKKEELLAKWKSAAK